MAKREKSHTIKISTSMALTHADRIARGDELAAKEKEYSEVSAEKADVMGQYKTRIDVIGERIDYLVKVINEGHELRDVEVRIVPDIPRRVIQYLRVESDDVVDERAMTPDEIEAAEQGDLFTGGLDLGPIPDTEEPALAQ